VLNLVIGNQLLMNAYVLVFLGQKCN